MSQYKSSIALDLAFATDSVCIINASIESNIESNAISVMILAVDKETVRPMIVWIMFEFQHSLSRCWLCDRNCKILVPHLPGTGGQKPNGN